MPERHHRPKHARAIGSTHLMVERRYATILFCDLAGYTALSERLDLEDLRDVQMRYQALATGIIERWGGFVASFQGDGVLAFFGYPSAHETDAERAIRAGLELTERVPGLSAASNGGGGRSHAPLSVRVGLHTGLVMISPDPANSSTGGHGAVGEAVNLAARLQAAGPPGAVLVSLETLELVEGLFDTEPLGPQEIRGLSRVVFVHRVLRARSVADRGWNRARRGATRLVGRDRPLRELVQHWHEAAREGTFRFVHVLGEAGVGKTRLVAELCAQVKAEEASAVQASCLEIFSNTPLYPAASLLWSRSGLTAEDGAARSRAKILRFLSAFGRKAAPEEVEIAAGLLGIRGTAPDESAEASSPLIKQKQFALLTSLLERAMGDQPLLLWVEDAHWLDRSSAELLAYLAERFANRPVLAVLTARAPLPEASLTPAAATIRLVPLPLTDCFELARAVPGARALPDEVLLRAAEAADSIPLFAEQLALSLIDQSTGKDGDARRPATPSDVALPLGLAEMLWNASTGSARREASSGRPPARAAPSRRTRSPPSWACRAPTSSPRSTGSSTRKSCGGGMTGRKPCTSSATRCSSAWPATPCLRVSAARCTPASPMPFAAAKASAPCFPASWRTTSPGRGISPPRRARGSMPHRGGAPLGAHRSR